MPNYYEILKIAPTADVTEIESVLDAQYEQWSSLVTHQDPKLQLQAQQALQVIEEMRTTLLDPAKRKVYDQAIGVGGAVGGLVDPNIVLQMPAGLGATMTPHTPPAPTAKQAPAQPQPTGPGLWTCSKGHDNPPDTHYCQRCGEELVRTCPECGQLKSLHSTGLCGNCGYKYEVAVERKALSERISPLSREVSDLQSKLAQTSAAKPFGCWSRVIALGALYAVGVGVVNLAGGNNTSGPVVAVLVAGIVFVLVFVRYAIVHGEKERNINNLTAELEPKERELAVARQRYSALSLRRTGDE